MKITDIYESTTSGSVATVAAPMTTQSRNASIYGGQKGGNLLTGKKTNKKYANSVNESKMKELAMDMRNMDNGNFQKKYKKSKEQLKFVLGDPDAKKTVQDPVKEGYYSVRSNNLKQELENNGWERIPAREVPDNAKYGYRKNGVGRFYKVIDEPYHSFDVSFVKPRRVIDKLVPLDTLLQLIRGSAVTEGDKRPNYVVTTKDKPKIVKPSMGGESPHPYQGKLVGATESSQWGEPEDVLRQVLQTLEREVEWPLTDVMDPQQVKQLLSPLMQAVSQKLNSLDEAEVGSTDYQWTHGKKPSGQGSWFFVAHRGGVNFSKDVEGEDYIQLNQMNYADAKKAAVKWAKSKGHTSLFVAT
jgi:hypothetical protein